MSISWNLMWWRPIMCWNFLLLPEKAITLYVIVVVIRVTNPAPRSNGDDISALFINHVVASHNVIFRVTLCFLDHDLFLLLNPILYQNSKRIWKLELPDNHYMATWFFIWVVSGTAKLLSGFSFGITSIMQEENPFTCYMFHRPPVRWNKLAVWHIFVWSG